MPVELGSFIPSFLRTNQVQKNPWSIGPVFSPDTLTLADKWGDSAGPWGIRKVLGEGILDPLFSGQKRFPTFEADPNYKRLSQFWSRNHNVANWSQNLIGKYAYLQQIFPDKSAASYSGAAKNAFGGTSTYANVAGSAAGTVIPAMGYAQMLGLDSTRMAALRQSSGSFAEAAQKAFNVKDMATHARSALLQGEQAGASTAKNFFQKVVLNQNTKNVLGPLSEGKFLVGGLMSLAWLVMGLSVLRSTSQAYSNAMDRNEGFFKAVWDAGKTFVTKGIKMLAAWEMAGIGYALGTAAFTLATGATGGLALLAVGVAVGALFSGGTHVALSKIMPEPDRRVS